MTNEKLQKAKNLFFDSQDYDEAILLAYYELVSDIFNGALDNCNCAIVLSFLQNICNKHLSASARDILTLKYGLDGRQPVPLQKIANKYSSRASRISELCKNYISILSRTDIARIYSIKHKADYIRNIHSIATKAPKTPGVLCVTDDIKETNLSEEATSFLKLNGINSIEQFVIMSRNDILKIPHIRKKKLILLEILNTHQELLGNF